MKLNKGDIVRVTGKPKGKNPFQNYIWPDVYEQYIDAIVEVANISPGAYPNCYEVVTYRLNSKTKMPSKFYDFELELIRLNGWDD